MPVYYWEFASTFTYSVYPQLKLVGQQGLNISRDRESGGLNLFTFSAGVRYCLFNTKK